jgi:hypothetical protein
LNNVESNKDVIKVKQTGKTVLSIEVTGRDDLLPTMMDEGSVERGGRTEIKLLSLGVVWLEALEFVTQSMTAGVTIIVVWKE